MPSDKAEINRPSMAARPSGASDPAAAARDQIIKDAVAELKQAQAEGGSGVRDRPWHEDALRVDGCS
jgi:hypothetical protein